MYQGLIRSELARMGFVGQFDPRHIEAYIRVDHSTLDGLSRSQFLHEIRIGIECIKTDGIVNAEQCAKSFGL